MSRITQVHYDAAGRVIGRTVTQRQGCCGSSCALLLLLFVLTAPAYYAARDAWPLGWPGAVLAYLLLAALLAGGIAAAVNRARAGGTAVPTGYGSGPGPQAAPRPPAPPLAGELERLAELHRSGGLSDAEFAAAKRALLG